MATKTELNTELAELAEEIMFDLRRDCPETGSPEIAADFARIFADVISETVSHERDGLDGSDERVEPIAVSLLRQVDTSALFSAYDFAERFVAAVEGSEPAH